MFKGFKFREELKVGMKFRYSGFCEDLDIEIIEITYTHVICRSVRHPNRTRIAHKEYDENGFGIKRIEVSRFLNQTHPQRCHQLIPYNGDSRY